MSAVTGHRSLTLLGSLAAVLAVTTPVSAQQEFPNPGEITVANVSTVGNGCPAGSVVVDVSPDNKALTVLFDSFVVDAAESPSGINRKVCDFNIGLITPPGWALSLFKTQIRGYAYLENGARGRQKASYQFDNNPAFTLNTMTLNGPLDRDYQNSSSVPIGTSPYSACGSSTKVLKFRTEIEAEGHRIPNAPAIVNCGNANTGSAECTVHDDITSLSVQRVISRAPCIKDRSFGYRGNKIWVNGGCRADFRVTFDPVGGGNPPDVDPSALMTVDSLNGSLEHEYGIAWKRCSMNPPPFEMDCGTNSRNTVQCETGVRISRVEKIRQISPRAPCNQNQTWGVTGTKIWVNNGCQARFRVYPAP